MGQDISSISIARAAITRGRTDSKTHSRYSICRQAAGKAAGDFLRDLVLNKNVIIQTIKSPSGSDKQEKYGRCLGIIWLDGANINDLLVNKGHAIRSDY